MRVESDDGEFVSGLTPADFAITVDGVVTPITLLYEVGAEGGAGDDAEAEDGASALIGTLGFEMQPTSEVRPKEQRRFLFFLDFMAPTRASVRYSVAGIVYFLENLVRPGDLVGMALYSDSGFRFLVPFTDRHARIKAMAQSMSPEQFREPDALAQSDLGDLRAFEAAVSGPAIAPDAAAIITDSLQQSEDDRRRGGLLAYIDVIEYLGELLRVMVGNTHVIFLSRGFNARALEDRIVGDAFEDALHALELSGTIVHAIDPSALEGITVHDPSFLGSGVDLGNLRGAFPSAFSRRGPLADMAQRTGGTTTWQSYNLQKGLRKADAASSRYYVLGFATPDSETEVTVDVRIVGRRAQVVGFPRRVVGPPRYRDWGEDQRQLAVAEALSGGRDRTGLELVAGLATTGAAAGGSEADTGAGTLATAAVYFATPFSSLPGAPGDPVELEVLIVAMDPDGRVVDFIRDGVLVVGDSGSEPHVRYLAELLVSQLGGQLVLLVRERATGALASRTMALSPHDEEAWIGRPVLLAPGGDNMPIWGAASQRIGRLVSAGELARPWPLAVGGAALANSIDAGVDAGGTGGIFVTLFGADVAAHDVTYALTLAATDGTLHTLPMSEAARQAVAGGLRVALGFAVPAWLDPAEYAAAVHASWGGTAVDSERFPVRVRRASTARDDAS